MSHPDAKFLERYLKPLEGMTIVRVEAREENDFGYKQAWPVLHVEKAGAEFELEISQDEEGNGPGFIFGLPLPGQSR